MPLLAGDLGFVTGLAAGRNQGAASAASEWKVYSQGLSNQISALSQQLRQEQIGRITNRADIAGIMSALASLSPEIQAHIAGALQQKYGPAFVHRAVELGLPQEYAAQAAQVELAGTLKMLPANS